MITATPRHPPYIQQVEIPQSRVFYTFRFNSLMGPRSFILCMYAMMLGGGKGKRDAYKSFQIA